MILTRLKITNLRAIENAEFLFQPGFNLIVGVNGVGKTTVLDALRICQSRILRSWTKPRAKPISFEIEDIRSDFPFLDAELSLTINEEDFHFTRRQWREPIAADNEENLKNLQRKILESERLRDRAVKPLRELDETHGVYDSDFLLPSEADFAAAAYASRVAPNGVFFSTDRSVFSSRRPTESMATGGIAVAYAGALVSRPMYVSHFAHWMRAQAILAVENSAVKRNIDVIRSTVERFLPTYENLRPTDEETPRLLVDHDGTTLDVRKLSDGERGVLALVLDLARRLSQANPSLNDPLSEGYAVVLIDELELHLHPTWQRQIVHNLTNTFPRCQFIATTHSPQVIGEVEHDQIHIMADGEVFSPTHSFGVDSSRVLEEIMDADPRATEVEQLLTAVSKEIGRQRYDHARRLLDQLVDRLGESDPEVTRISTLLDFMEGEV